MGDIEVDLLAEAGHLPCQRGVFSMNEDEVDVRGTPEERLPSGNAPDEIP
jgi:hypothetical protein